MPPPNPTAKALLGAAGLVLVAGAALAITQPGDLGDDDADTAAPAVEETTTTTLVDDGTTTAPSSTVVVTTTTTASTTPTTSGDTGTTAGGITVTTAAPVTTATTAVTTATDVPQGETTTTLPGSGLGNGGASVADDATATTGIESLLGPGLGLAAVAFGARALARRRPAG